MSSSAVRTIIKAQLVLAVAGQSPAVKVIDITGRYEEIEDFLEDEGIDQLSDSWIGIQYLSASEYPIDILSNNVTGKYREEGDVYVHVVSPTVGGYESTLILSEVIRKYFRGKRIGNLVVENVNPPQFGRGISLNFEAGMTSGLVSIGYHYDLVLS